MELTLVEYMADGRLKMDYFVGKTLAQIHAALHSKCPTYQILHVIHAEEARPVPLKVFEKFKDNTLTTNRQ